MSKSEAWTFGLMSHGGKYLTAESFGFKLAASAMQMKKKQIFTLIGPAADGSVQIQSHLGKLLAVDGDGGFVADRDSGDDDETRFVIEANDEGQWAIKSQKYEWYVEGTGEGLSAFTGDGVKRESQWNVRLAMHPHIALRNVGRKRFVHTKNGALTTDEDIPWGDDAVIELKWNDASKSYQLWDCNGLALDGKNGALVDPPTPDCDFNLHFDGANVAFQSIATRKFLTSLGGSGLMKASKSSVTTMEQYQFQDSFPQIELRAANGKLVSMKGGVELSANCSADASDNETFQVEPQGGDVWVIKTEKEKLWGLDGPAVHHNMGSGGSGTVVADESNYFQIEFNDGTVSLKASNGQYVMQQPNNQLKAVGAAEQEGTAFHWALVNRPRIILRTEHGFVAATATGSMKGNSSMPTTFSMTADNAGKYVLDGVAVADGNVVAGAGAGAGLYIELLPESKMYIKTADDGTYWRAGGDGSVKSVSDRGSATAFEY
jgi:fascin 1/2